MAYFDFSQEPTQPKLIGMGDLESAGDQWTGDNSFTYRFSLYGRKWVDDSPVVDDFGGVAGDFCKGRATGSYIWNGQRFECESDSYNGGWVEIADVQDLQSHSGDLEPTKWEIPSWFGDAGINQYLWVDEGSILDYAAGSGSWRAEGWDSGKHLFSGTDGQHYMIKDLGENGWSFKDQCNAIENYQLTDHSGLCQFRAENRP